MKKIILSFIILCVATVAWSQNYYFGPKLGVNLAALRGESSSGPASTSDFRAGLQAGLAFDLGINKYFSIAPEIYFSQQGFSESDNNYIASMLLNYVNIPVLFRGSIKFKGGRFYVNTGPQLGIFVSGSAKSGSVSADLPDDFIAQIDLSAVFGGGFGIDAGPGQIMIDFRYGFGITNIAGSALTKQEPSIEMNNRVIGLSLGYIFKL